MSMRSRPRLGSPGVISYSGVGIDRVLRIQDSRTWIASPGASASIYSADPYNYLRFDDNDMTPAAIVAPLGTSGPGGIFGADVMI